jgi:hypothetical protein
MAPSWAKGQPHRRKSFAGSLNLLLKKIFSEIMTKTNIPFYSDFSFYHVFSNINTNSMTALR